jgi:hypothetical protein
MLQIVIMEFSATVGHAAGSNLAQAVYKSI